MFDNLQKIMGSRTATVSELRAAGISADETVYGGKSQLVEALNDNQQIANKAMEEASCNDIRKINKTFNETVVFECFIHSGKVRWNTETWADKNSDKNGYYILVSNPYTRRANFRVVSDSGARGVDKRILEETVRYENCDY